jgi:hypothetical protein
MPQASFVMPTDSTVARTKARDSMTNSQYSITTLNTLSRFVKAVPTSTRLRSHLQLKHQLRKNESILTCSIHDKLINLNIEYEEEKVSYVYSGSFPLFKNLITYQSFLIIIIHLFKA